MLVFVAVLSCCLDDSAMGCSGKDVPGQGGHRCVVASLWIISSSKPVDVDGCPMALIDSTTPILMLFMTLMACAVPAAAACGGAGNAS